MATRLARRQFGSSLRINLADKFTRVDSKLDPVTKQLSMQINLASSSVLTFTRETELKTIRDKLLASGAKAVDFFTMKGAILPVCERVGDLQNFPILMQVDGGARTFALNFSQEFQIEKRTDHAIKDEEYYSDFAQGIGLKGYARIFLPYFAHRF